MMKKWLAGLVTVALGVVGLVVFLNGQTAQCQTPTVCNQPITPAMYVGSLQNQPHFLLDVRTPDEFAGGHIASATNISIETLAANLQHVPRDTPVVVYCRSGNRSAQAVQLLSDAGYTTIYDLGGINAWQAQGLPIVKS
jgi:rhodanese-related sulfurtransferase